VSDESRFGGYKDPGVVPAGKRSDPIRLDGRGVRFFDGLGDSDLAVVMISGSMHGSLDRDRSDGVGRIAEALAREFEGVKRDDRIDLKIRLNLATSPLYRAVLWVPRALSGDRADAFDAAYRPVVEAARAVVARLEAGDLPGVEPAVDRLRRAIDALKTEVTK
jgi:hypothetical protein